MSKEQAIIHYLAAMSVFRKWRELDIISNQELHEIESLTAGNYNLPKGSIYR